MLSKQQENKGHVPVKQNCPVLLLHPPMTLKKEDVPTFGFFPPLGLGYIASILLKEGYPVEIIDCLVEGADTLEENGEGLVRLGLSKEKIESLLKEKRPTIVGISNSFFSFSGDGIRLAEIVRACLPDAFVVIGGAATPELKSLLSSNVIDVIVTGEAEFIFRDLVQHISSGKIEEAKKVTGTIWKVGKDVITNPSREITMDLNKIPYPAYHLLPMQKYIWQKHANFSAAMRWPIGHMITSRGCMYNCIFCSTTKYFAKFRERSVENIIGEMKLLHTTYGIQEFHFHDDFFMSNKEHIRKLCHRIIEEKMDIRWQVSQGINIVHLDEEMLELMHKSGMYRVGFPIESGSREILKYSRKPMNLEKAQKLIEKCNYLGIYVFGCFIIGFPEETKEQLQETVDFIASSGLDYAKISILQPHPGTDIFGVYTQLGLLEEGLKHGSTYFHTEYNTVHMTAAELNATRCLALKKFAKHRIIRMFSPTGIQKYLIPKVYSWEATKYLVRMSWSAIKGF